MARRTPRDVLVGSRNRDLRQQKCFKLSSYNSAEIKNLFAFHTTMQIANLWMREAQRENRTDRTWPNYAIKASIIERLHWDVSCVKHGNVAATRKFLSPSQCELKAISLMQVTSGNFVLMENLNKETPMQEKFTQSEQRKKWKKVCFVSEANKHSRAEGNSMKCSFSPSSSAGSSTTRSRNNKVARTIPRRRRKSERSQMTLISYPHSLQ